MGFGQRGDDHIFFCKSLDGVRLALRGGRGPQAVKARVQPSLHSCSAVALGIGQRCEMTHRQVWRGGCNIKEGFAAMPTTLPPRPANKQAVDLSAVMFTLVAAMLTMLIMNPTVANKGAAMGFAFAPSLNQSARSSYD
jgi:hypothetical protein